MTTRRMVGYAMMAAPFIAMFVGVGVISGWLVALGIMGTAAAVLLWVWVAFWLAE